VPSVIDVHGRPVPVTGVVDLPERLAPRDFPTDVTAATYADVAMRQCCPDGCDDT